MKRIESPRNAIFKEALDLVHVHGKHRLKEEKFIIEGSNLIDAAIKSGKKVKLHRIFLTREAEGKFSDLIGLAGPGVEIHGIADHLLKRIADTETPSGIIAIASYIPMSLDIIELSGLIAVVDGIQDPGNLGSIIRTSDAAGIGAVVVLHGSVDPFSPKAMRATAGSIFNISLFRAERKYLIEALRQKAIPLVVTSPHSRTSIFEADIMPPAALVFGHETRGVSSELVKESKIQVSVPIRGKAESLNVAAAAAVIIFETVRKAHY